MQLKIDPEFRSLIPPLSAEEMAQLEANIVRDGCRDSLVVWKGVLLDGHNRYSICTKHGLVFGTVDIALSDRSAAIEWIIRNQFGRRNLPAYVRGELALRLEAEISGRAKSKEKIRKTTCQKSDKSSAPPIDTKRELAAIAGVSHDTIAKIKKLDKVATPQMKEKLRSGQISVHEAYKSVTVHVGHNSGENEWYTPPEFIESARKVMGIIDVDPASSEIANKTVKAKKFFTKDDDGLKQKWKGNVWMNPPYAQPLMSHFAEAITYKFQNGEIEQAIVLVNNATETQWWQRMAGAASVVCFPKSRVRFLDPNGNPGAPLQGQSILYFGKNGKQFVAEFKKYGATFP